MGARPVWKAGGRESGNGSSPSISATLEGEVERFHAGLENQLPKGQVRILRSPPIVGVITHL